MNWYRFLVVLPLGYLALFLIYPLVAILIRSFGYQGDTPISPFTYIMGNSYYLTRIWFTIWQAAVSTFLSLIVGLPIAYLFTRFEFPGKTILKALSTVPFVMPTIVVAIGLVSLLGPSGILNTTAMNLFNLDNPPIRVSNSLTMIFIAHAFYNYAIIVRIVSTFAANLDQNVEETARMLGASSWRSFYNVTLPLLFPAIASAALLAFAFSFTSFGVVLVLGGSKFATIEVSIYELTTKLFQLPLAGALAIVQIIFTYLFLLLYTKLQERMTVIVGLKPNESTAKKTTTWTEKMFVGSSILLIILVLSPLISLVIKLFYVGDSHTPSHVANLFSNHRGSFFYLSPIQIMWNSIRFAFATVIISLVMGTIAAYFLAKPNSGRSSYFDAMFMLPLGVTAITLGFGYIITFNHGILDLRGSSIILVVAHSLIAYPFVIRSILPILRSINPNLKEVSYMLGASQLSVFRHIDIPIIGRGILVGAIFAFAISMGEFGASLILLRPENTTMPVAIFQFLGKPGEANLVNALAMSGLLMALVTTIFIAIERFRFRGLGSF